MINLTPKNTDWPGQVGPLTGEGGIYQEYKIIENGVKRIGRGESVEIERE